MKTIPAENISVSGPGGDKSPFECIYTSVATFSPLSGRMGIEGFQPTLLSALPAETMQPAAARISPRAWSSSSWQPGTPPSGAQAQPPGRAAEDDSGGAEGIAAAVLCRRQQSVRKRTGRAQHPTSENVSPAFRSHRRKLVSPAKGTSPANDLRAKIFAR